MRTLFQWTLQFLPLLWWRFDVFFNVLHFWLISIFRLRFHSLRFIFFVDSRFVWSENIGLIPLQLGSEESFLLVFCSTKHPKYSDHCHYFSDGFVLLGLLAQRPSRVLHKQVLHELLFVPLFLNLDSVAWVVRSSSNFLSDIVLFLCTLHSLEQACLFLDLFNHVTPLPFRLFLLHKLLGCFHSVLSVLLEIYAPGGDPMVLSFVVVFQDLFCYLEFYIWDQLSIHFVYFLLEVLLVHAFIYFRVCIQEL